MSKFRKVEEKVLTKWEYNGDEDNSELSFYAGEIITVKDKLLGQPEFEGMSLVLFFITFLQHLPEFHFKLIKLFRLVVGRNRRDRGIFSNQLC